MPQNNFNLNRERMVQLDNFVMMRWEAEATVVPAESRFQQIHFFLLMQMSNITFTFFQPFWFLCAWWNRCCPVPPRNWALPRGLYRWYLQDFVGDIGFIFDILTSLLISNLEVSHQIEHNPVFPDLRDNILRKKLLVFWILPKIPPSPQFGQLVQLFSDVKIQDLKF